MPDFQHDHFPLFRRQFRQATHRHPFLRRFFIRALEPTARLQLAREPPPHPAPVIERPIAKASDTIMLRLLRQFLALKQRYERFVQHVFRFGVAQAQRAAIEDQLSGFRLVQPFAPMNNELLAHTFTE